MKNTGIYRWTSPSGKYYIGQAIDPQRRKKEFTTNPFNYTYTSNDSAIDRARKKYPNFNDWEYKILAYADNEEELNELEIKYIAFYESTNSRKGYNSTKGGDGSLGTAWGSEAQLEALKNRRSYKGEANPNFGKHHTEETKEKIRNARLGSKQSAETIMKKSKPINQYTLDGNLSELGRELAKQ
ncbi:MAG: GIY-YIG nuclease family protein [Firmicutes bacterium]|nr:GIY-YIG nuclease family protein [Bacillota bacterium]